MCCHGNRISDKVGWGGQGIEVDVVDEEVACPTVMGRVALGTVPIL